jgi:predicted transcriptional regulator
MAVNDKASLNPLQWTGEDIVEYILLLCAGELTFDDLMQLMTSSSPTILKKYLFYLIDYDLISYNGQKQVYLIRDKGLELLSRIMMENKKVFSWEIL